MAIIKNLVIAIWNTNVAFVAFKKERPEQTIEMVKTLGNQIDQNVINEIETIKATADEFVSTHKVDRNKFLKSILASELLIDYLQRVLTAK